MDQIIAVKEKFDEITAARGKAKEAVIAKYKDDALFLEVLDFVYSPYFTTGIAKKKMEKEVTKYSVTITDTDIYAAMKYLRQNNSGSDKVIAAMQKFIRMQPEETHEFLRGLFTQDIQSGVGIKSINSALGYEYIKEHNLQNARKWKDEGHKLEGEFAILIKLDGIRGTVKNHFDKDLEILSKSGLPIEGCLKLESILNKLPKGFVYDGELLYTDKDMNADDRFRKTSSILRTKGEKNDLMYVIFDMMPIEEFEAGESKLPWKERFQHVRDMLDGYARQASHFPEQFELEYLVEQVECFYIGEDKSQIKKWLDYVLEKKYEGLIINKTDSKYLASRHAGILKIKEFYTADLRIIGFKEHKHGNKLGAFIVDYKGNELNVGYGFKDHERVDFWNRQDEMLGKIIEVEYFQPSTNKKGTESVRHGGFIRVRWDKNDVSYD